MKLLIITQTVDKNDDILGFFHTWISSFAQECEEVTVIALRVGAYTLPSNVRVLSLGKENGISRIKYLYNFYRYILRERKKYDTVLVHMNQVYVILGGCIWKFMKKTVALWYTHGHVSNSLRLATVFADKIFTATAGGFRIKTDKLRVIGHGIDTERFQYGEHRFLEGKPFRVIVVGRISPVKDYETALRALAIAKNKGYFVQFDVIGGADTTSQKEYLQKLKMYTSDLNLISDVVFHGALPNVHIAEQLARAHCFVSTSHTGSFDKAVGEAMAAGLPILTSNEAFRDVLGNHSSKLMFTPGDESALAELLIEMIKKTNAEREQLGYELSQIISQHHSLWIFVKKLIRELTS